MTITLEKLCLEFRERLNVLEDKGYYTPQLVTKNDIREYRTLNKRWLIICDIIIDGYR